MIGGIIDSFVHDQSMLQRDEQERHFHHNNWNGGLFILFNRQNEDSNRSRNTCLESTFPYVFISYKCYQFFIERTLYIQNNNCKHATMSTERIRIFECLGKKESHVKLVGTLSSEHQMK